MKTGVISGLRPEHPDARLVSDLVRQFGFEVHGDVDGVAITGITLSSKSVEPGDLYVGLAGVHAHGAQFSEDARAKGAVAIVTDARGQALAARSGLPVLVIDDPRASLGALSAWVYQTAHFAPVLFGVTGTNGKTSVAYIIEAILRQLGVLAGLSTTAERRIGDFAVTSTLTTPEATEVHGLLARMREADAEAVVIETSAQALTRHRVDGIVFDVVGFTNLTHDHLDDYGTMQKYFEAKAPLFTAERAKRGVVINDAEWGTRLARAATIPVTQLSTHPGKAADWYAAILRESIEETRFILNGPDNASITTSIPVLGRHMAENAALALVMLVEAGYPLADIGAALDRDGGIRVYIPGRSERIPNNGPAVFIDYGHSPDAFTSTLDSLRRVTEGRIIMLFGADGDRDPSKRVEMGQIAARLSDVVVVTDFHPRSEDPAAIRKVLVDAARAAVPGREMYEVADPRDAFRKALSVATPDDVILYAGPGHEDYHEVKGEHIPYSARDDARLALHESGWL
ncbi:Mur ligase family protein [Subtercola boreus]|uniref:UDP-N-acetylmuramyl-tripeptide synthetase n=1 Tax=Subtercola boreus TaxID=120213 RepID=A0A3E0WBX5_9MICO|nr:UDP-N-acetylmuramoyl-L-alanyl-D-glutamate--2,6-diaminopimelate ligase [Subtercola boreus]RFA21091.1 UDP-N-acetylmuramyl peptide synthase [Subtercola boreus]RFA21475.1 UDP-N-acetylmuramyl peptide synthase [Subtercola boreus]RFA27446.1 UDP-N-acetylmuramyl peptide synthase [Subtercola boreus]